MTTEVMRQALIEAGLGVAVTGIKMFVVFGSDTERRASKRIRHLHELVTGGHDVKVSKCGMCGVIVDGVERDISWLDERRCAGGRRKSPRYGRK